MAAWNNADWYWGKNTYGAQTGQRENASPWKSYRQSGNRREKSGEQADGGWDWENQGGRWGGSRDGDASQGGNPGGADSWAAQMKAAQDAQLAARADALKLAEQSYQAQKAQLSREADAARGQAYTNARLSAIGNNEQLAANGLAGGLYQTPASGYSETSRTADNIAMRGNIGAVTASELQARAQIDAAVSELVAQGRLEDANLVANNAQALIQLMLQEKQIQTQQEQFQQSLDWAREQFAREMDFNYASSDLKNPYPYTKNDETKENEEKTDPAKVAGAIGDTLGDALGQAISQLVLQIASAKGIPIQLNQKDWEWNWD